MKCIIILIVFVSLFLNNAIAQNCSYEKNTIDEFTDKTILQTSPEMFINFSEKVKCSLGRIDSLKFILLELTTGKSLYKIGKENLLYLILDNGEKTQFEPIELIVFSNKIHGYNNIKVAYELRDLEKIKSSSISKMRVTTSDGFFEYEIKKKGAKNLFIEQLSCIN